jgi:hypothetical protein
MGAYIVGMITGTVCLVVSLCYLGAMGQVQVRLATGAAITGLVVLLVCTLMAAVSARGKKAPAKPTPAKAEPERPPEPGAEPKPEPDDEAVELPGIDEA